MNRSLLCSEAVIELCLCVWGGFLACFCLSFLFFALVSLELVFCILHTKGIYLSMDIPPSSENVNTHTHTYNYIPCHIAWLCLHAAGRAQIERLIMCYQMSGREREREFCSQSLIWFSVKPIKLITSSVHSGTLHTHSRRETYATIKFSSMFEPILASNFAFGKSALKCYLKSDFQLRNLEFDNQTHAEQLWSCMQN